MLFAWLGLLGVYLSGISSWRRVDQAITRLADYSDRLQPFRDTVMSIIFKPIILLDYCPTAKRFFHAIQISWTLLS